MRSHPEIAILYLPLLTIAACTSHPPDNSVTTLNPQGVAGIYEAMLPAADAPGRRVILSLRPDSSATLRTEIPGKSAVPQEGRWSSLPPQIRFDFQPVSGRRPDSITWTIHNDELVPLIWDKKEYGQEGLKLHRTGSTPGRSGGGAARVSGGTGG